LLTPAATRYAGCEPLSAPVVFKENRRIPRAQAKYDSAARRPCLCWHRRKALARFRSKVFAASRRHRRSDWDFRRSDNAGGGVVCLSRRLANRSLGSKAFPPFFQRGVGGWICSTAVMASLAGVVYRCAFFSGREPPVFARHIFDRGDLTS